MSLRLIPLLAVLAFAGCGTGQRQAGALGTPFAGTWHLASTTSPDAPAGFLALDGERVLFNLDGLPRGAVAISANDTDAGLRSGRVVCADGRILYLAVGDSLTVRDTTDGRVLAPTPHLDVHVFAPGAGAGDQPQKVLRLWPSTALAVAALRDRQPAPAAAAPVAVASGTGNTTPHDQRFIGTLERLRDPYLAGLALRLSGARQDGLDQGDLDVLYRRSTQVVRSEVLRDLDAARRGEAMALTRADQTLADLAIADRAYATWRDRP